MRTPRCSPDLTSIRGSKDGEPALRCLNKPESMRIAVTISGTF
jgi:hypothetical protein